MAAKRGFYLLVAGLILGLAVGIAYRAVEQYATDQVVELLADEIRDSCPCTFEYDTFEINLATLTAHGTNARIVSEGENKLFFREVRARFSLAKAFKRIITLSEIRLIDGLAKGIDEESATFKFIDTLTTAPPPDKQRPNRWKAELELLTVERSRFFEDLDGIELLGQGVAMTLKRNLQNDFDLNPSIDQLKLVLPTHSDRPQPLTLSLGKVTSQMVIREPFIDFKRLQLVLGQTKVLFKGLANTKEGNKLEGAGTVVGDLLDVPGIDGLLNGEVQGTGNVFGSLGKPKVDLSLDSVPNTISSLVMGDAATIPFSDLQAQLFIDGSKRPIEVNVRDLTATRPGSEARITTPIVIGELFRGSLTLTTDEIVFSQGYTLKNAQMNIALGGTPRAPTVMVVGTADRVESLGFSITPINFEYSKHGARYSVKAESRQSSGGRATLQIDSFQERDAALPTIDGKLSLQNIEVRSSAGEGLPLAVINSEVQLKGPTTIRELHGNGSMRITSPRLSEDFAMSGQLTIAQGKASFSLANTTQTLTAQLALSGAQQGGELTVEAKNFNPQEAWERLECSELSLNGSYKFSFDTLLAGSGEILLHRAGLGCGQYNMTIPSAVKIPIQNGSLSLAALSFKNNESTLKFGGTISLERGFLMEAHASMNLASLLPFLPTLDDVRGTTKADLDFNGPFESPTLAGSLTITDGALSSASANIDASNIHADLSLGKNTVNVKHFTGELNGGTLEVKGSYAPFEKKPSALTLHLKNILLEPNEALSLAFSAQVQLGLSEKLLPALSGQVQIESGEIRQQVDLLTILSALREAITPSSAESTRTDTTPVALDLDIVLPGNLLVITNWAGAELRGRLKARGTVGSPSLDGTVESVTGWFGFRDRKFEITSGQLIFSPENPRPILDLVSETTVRSRLGENVFMILEAKGDISAPQLSLSSNSGLSERELLTLFTTGQQTLQMGTLTSTSKDLELSDDPLLSLGSGLSVEDFLRGLTRIDVLSIEPTFNEQTGAVEPTILAEKKLTSFFSLFGRNSFSAGLRESAAGGILQLAQGINLIGSLESNSIRENTAVSLDAAFIILESQKPFLNTEVKGNTHIPTPDLLRRLRISNASRIRESDLPRLIEDIKEIFFNDGYRDVHTTVHCDYRFNFCRTLYVEIEEGSGTMVDRVILEGDELPEFIRKQLSFPDPKQELASLTLSNSIRDDITSRLRNEGFIAARVENSYSAKSDALMDLRIEVTLNQPVTFNFQGNTVFSAAELLDTINLFTRRQAFGSNTINILIQNIERAYREAGYLYAAVSYFVNTERESGRVFYTITITEEERINVSSVIFEGNHALTQKDLRDALTELSPTIAETALTPRVALSEEVDNISDVLQEIYAVKGYPDTRVKGEIIPDKSGSNVEIRYRIEEGVSNLRSWLIFENLPELKALPGPPAELYSIPQANQLIEEVMTTLRENGYLNAGFSSRFDPDRNQLVILIDAGSRAIIREISIEGLEQIDRQVILRTITLKAGDPWNLVDIDLNRRDLLKLGLFSQIEILPADGAVDSAEESLVIRVDERPLQSLSIGAGANSEYGLHLFGEATDRGIFSDGRTLTMRVDSYYDRAESDISRGIANLRYADPFIFGKNITLTEDLRFQKLERSTQEFDLERVSLGSYLQKHWDQGTTFSSGHTILEEDLSNVPSDAVLSDLDEGIARLSFLSGLFAYDQRNNPLYPTDGYAVSFDYKLSAQPLASEADFYSLGTRASVLSSLPVLGPRFSVAASSRVASSWTFGSTNEVPISQRFYLGGRDTVRGFRENSLGPQGDEGSVLGGDLLVAASSELQYRAEDSLSLHLFIDSGTVYLRDESVSIDDLRYSTGLGFRYLSPIGPLGLDFGHPIDERPGEPSWRVHFNVGSNF